MGIFYSNRGMTLICGSNWRDYFDVIIVNARKPKFFTNESRPLRLYEEQNDSHQWERVTKLEKGYVYYEVRITLKPSFKNELIFINLQFSFYCVYITTNYCLAHYP